jgi:allophanate hydrolase
MTSFSFDLTTLREGYRTAALRPSLVVEEVLRRIAAAGDDHVWISRVTDAELRAAAARLDALQSAGGPDALPLFGVPFAVKDNIDVAGLPTTAACPDFAYRPAASAPVVERLLRAGALLVGKTNLDQFATGLVGTRSPYGVSRNPFDAAFLPGGSSSGSAVAVAAGLVGFALGTDTAGSGRVPAAFNNIVGLKPTRGLVPTIGVVPACRSLDCVSIFALTVDDAMAALEVARGPAPGDPYGRTPPPGYTAVVPPPRSFRVAVPRRAQLRFFGNAAAETLFVAALERLQSLGGTEVEVDYAPFAEGAELLYGAFVSERAADLVDFMAARPDALHPVTKRILDAARRYTAIDLVRAEHRLEALRAEAAVLWSTADIMVLPTTGTIYRIGEVAADPLHLNANLGAYTNFVNLFDLSAIAVPSGLQPDGLPVGISLIGPAFHEPVLAGIAAAFHRAGELTLGATGERLPHAPSNTEPRFPWISLGVVGAHLSGMALNHELTAMGARLRRATRTAPAYRLYALPDGRRPGLVRVAEQGVAIEVEIWEVPSAAFGPFVAGIAPPLGIGSIELENGARVPGFLCEAFATASARDISSYGGWRAYVAAR